MMNRRTDTSGCVVSAPALEIAAGGLGHTWQTFCITVGRLTLRNWRRCLGAVLWFGVRYQKHHTTSLPGFRSGGGGGEKRKKEELCCMSMWGTCYASLFVTIMLSLSNAKLLVKKYHQGLKLQEIWSGGLYSVPKIMQCCIIRTKVIHFCVNYGHRVVLLNSGGWSH